MSSISPDKLAVYKRAAREREASLKQAMLQRREEGWGAARRAADLLKQEFGATRVVAFGSLAHGAWFNARSDIDLMAEGIPPEAFWRAWCALDRLGGPFEIDLIAGEAMPERLREEVEREGVEL